MFNVIVVRHRGSVDVPRFFTLDVSDLSIFVRVTGSNSFFPLRPALYSVSVQGIPVFSAEKPDISADPEPLPGEMYMARLSEFLSLHIAAEKARASTEMDLLRLYFVTNNMTAARMLLRVMPVNGDVMMLRFVSENLCDLSTVESRYFVSSSAFSGKGREAQATNKRVSNRKDLEGVLKICSGLDESTVTIFLLEIMDTVAPGMLTRLIEKVGISSAYNRTYLRIKAAERMLDSGMARMAAFTLISVSMEIASAQDRLLKNELVRIALGLVTDRGWYAEIEDALARIRAEEIRKYGAPLTQEIYRRAAGVLPEVTITSHTRFFSFQLFKSQMDGFCAGKLRIFNGDCAMIDGLLINTDEFVPIFSNSDEIVVDCANTFEGTGTVDPRDSIHVDAILLSTGQEVPVNREFRVVKRDCDVALVDVESVDGQTVYVFEISGDASAVSVQKGSGTLSIEGKVARLALGRGVRSFTVDVEVSRGVFEERTFCV